MHIGLKAIDDDKTAGKKDKILILQLSQEILYIAYLFERFVFGFLAKNTFY